MPSCQTLISTTIFFGSIIWQKNKGLAQNQLKNFTLVKIFKKEIL